MRRFGILAGGPDEQVPPLQQFTNMIDDWIGVDRGAISLIRKGIQPVQAFGDFDSITLEEKEILHKALPDLTIYPSEKDQTDLELAIDWLVKQGEGKCYLFGVTGGRLDHELAAIHLLQEGVNTDVRLMIVDRLNRIEVLAPGTHLVESIKGFPYLSLLSLSETIEGLSLEGFKYPLHEAELRQSTSLGISNEVIDQTAKIAFNKGMLLMIRSHD